MEGDFLTLKVSCCLLLQCGYFEGMEFYLLIQKNKTKAEPLMTGEKRIIKREMLFFSLNFLLKYCRSFGERG